MNTLKTWVKRRVVKDRGVKVLGVRGVNKEVRIKVGLGGEHDGEGISNGRMPPLFSTRRQRDRSKGD